MEMDEIVHVGQKYEKEIYVMDEKLWNKSCK
jgi:hypothetical protein